MNNSIKVLLGLSVGALAGFATGILVAPDKGVKTRKRIRKEAKQMQKELETAANKQLDEAKKVLNSKIEEYTDNGKKAIDDIKGKVKLS